MRRIGCMCLFAILLPVVSAFGAESLSIKTMSDWRIVLADEAITSEVYAAEEFQSLFEQATGTKLEIGNKRTDSGNVLIGPGSAGLETDDLGEEGLRIRIGKDVIAIAGGRPRGTLYGVYEFFEKYVGVRFLRADHTYIPDDAVSCRLPCEAYCYVPAFEFRWSYWYETNTNPAFAARSRTNAVAKDAKFGGIVKQGLINHSLDSQVPASKYGKDHPEYFAMVDGKHRSDMLDFWGHNRPNVCYAQEEVFKLVIDDVLTKLRTNPDVRNVSVSCPDINEYCRCPECEAINNREESPCGSHLDFVNRVAKVVEKEFPDRFVGTLAYLHTRKPPKTIKARDNVQIQLCSIECCIVHALDNPDCPLNVAFYDDLKGWGKISDNVYIWHYNTNFHFYDLPYPNLRSIGPNLRLFRDNNVKGVFMQAASPTPAAAMSDLKSYVISRCLWKPGRDSWRETLEFCRLHYGKASQPIIDWLTFFHDHVEANDVHILTFPKPGDLAITPEVALKAWRYYQKALELVGEDETLRNRVEKASICSYRALIETSPRVYRDGAYCLDFPEECDDVIGTYYALAEKYGLRKSNERSSVDWIKPLLEPRKALEIENSVWRVRVVPFSNGGVLEMLHKPTGREILRRQNAHTTTYWKQYGVIEEWVLQGIKSEGPEWFTVAFDAAKEGRKIVLTKMLEDGSSMAREIELPDDDSEKVYFRTTFKHEGEKPRVYQSKIHPEFYGIADPGDERATSLLVRKDGVWQELRGQWQEIPIEWGSLRLAVEGIGDGQVAMYGRQDGYGMVMSFDVEAAESLTGWRRPWRKQSAVDVTTRERKLEKGETFSYGYSVEYADDLLR